MGASDMNNDAALALLLQAADAAAQPAQAATATCLGVFIGELIGFRDTVTPLVRYDAPVRGLAIPARTTVDVRSEHVGHAVLLVFEAGHSDRPIITGVIRQPDAWPLSERPATVEVDSQGERLIVTAKHELTLRCGKASITLTQAGKVLINGTHVSSRSSGVNRIHGGSVQIN
ncbi:MAG: hypothetical protein KGQ77_07745 [Betaproteobacteria bacterium]|nr:hypothetical protein [Betaproteobacteria bacterium]